MIRKRLESFGRKALVADYGSPRNAALSSQGGVPLGLSTEVWPTIHGEPLFPVLTIFTRELPVVPEFLLANEYWAFFIQRDQYEHYVQDGSLVVRRYPSISGLVSLPRPIGVSTARRLGFSFTMVNDYPSRYALEKILGDESHGDALGDLEEKYPCHAGIKLGGWPCLIQGIAFLATEAPDFEMQLDGTDLYSYADSGIGHVYGGLKAIIWETM